MRNIVDVYIVNILDMFTWSEFEYMVLTDM